MKNPIFGDDAGDPYVLKDGDDYYLTCTGGKKADGFTGFVCYHSTDLEHWSEPVPILDFKDVTWAISKAWAPSMVKVDGLYYFAFCADQQIGVAVCESPMGTYRDALGKPLFTVDQFGFQTIDPCFFLDDDGKLYLLFGQGKCHMYRIAVTPTSVDLLEGPVDLTDMLYRQVSQNPNVEDKAVYNEAPDLVRLGDRYLFSWSIYDVLDYRYAVRYAWSRNVFGPYLMPKDYDHDNILLQGVHDITGCGHACVTEYRNDWYILYGRHKKRRDGREMCCERIVFEDAEHLVATPTREA